MLPRPKPFAIFKSKLQYSPFTVIGRCLQVHTSAPLQTGRLSFPRVSASAQGRAKDSSSALVLEFPWGNFTQYLNDKLQTSLPVCYLAIHLTQNTLPQKMTQIKIQISLWNLICRKCSKGNSPDWLLQWSLGISLSYIIYAKCRQVDTKV